MNNNLFDFRKIQLAHSGKIAYARNNVSRLGVEYLEKKYNEYRIDIDLFYQEAYNNISKYLTSNLIDALESKDITKGNEIVDNLNRVYEEINKKTLTIEEFNLLNLSFEYMYDYYNDPKISLELEDRSFYIGRKIFIGTLIIPFMVLLLSIFTYFVGSEITKNILEGRILFIFDSIFNSNINIFVILMFLIIVLLVNIVYKKIDNIIKLNTKYPIKFMLLPIYLSICITYLSSIIFFKILPNLDSKISMSLITFYMIYIIILVCAISLYFIRHSFLEKYLIEKAYDNDWNIVDIIGFILLLIFIVIPSIFVLLFNLFPILLEKNKYLLNFIAKISANPTKIINFGKILILISILITITMLIIDIVKQIKIKKA